MTSIVVEQLTKSFAGRPPVVALHAVHLVIPSGSIAAVVGPSGCGKTTLLRSIAGFERPDAGTITFDDRRVVGPGAWVPPERRRIGVVPQEGALFPHLDVMGNVAFPLGGRRRAGARERVGELLELVGLQGLAQRRPHELSGGQQQRVALARALAGRPEVVLLDEPFTALDATLRPALRAEVAAVLRTAGATAVVVTHDPAEALAMADTIAVMDGGRVVQAGASRDVYLAPVNLATACLLGDVVELDGRVDGDRATTWLGEVPVATPVDGDGTVLVVRPEQLIRDPSSTVVAQVTAVGFRGHDAEIELEVGARRVVARWPSIDLPAVGDRVPIAIRGAAALIRRE